MTGERRKTLSVVPEQHRWLRSLTDRLAADGVQWRSAVLADRVIRIRIGDEHFYIVVRPVGAGVLGSSSQIA